MKYDVTKCNNLNFKRASGLSGFMKVSPKGDCYFYQRDEIWDIGTMMLQPRFWKAVDFAEFNRFVEVNRIQIVPRNPETYTEWKVGDKVISNTGNKVNTIIAVLSKAIVLVRDAEVPITTLTSADDLTKYNKLVLTDYEKELIHAQEPEKRTGWINVYHYDGVGNANASRRIYDTKEEALACENKGRIDTIKIEWEE